MSPVAFLGPSRPRDLDDGIEIRPPAAAGDLLSLLSGPRRTVVLIDGVFDASAAPRHKEILVLLERGFPVLGAASMGALRAAEMDSFGMVGVGRVYEAYCRGLLEGDDEVALLHLPPSFGSTPATVPLVNVRATLGSAMRRRAIDRHRAAALMNAARSCHFTERDWPTIFSRASLDVSSSCAEWLSSNQVDVKADDAELALRSALSAARPPEVTAPSPPTIYLAELAHALGIDLQSS